MFKTISKKNWKNNLHHIYIKTRATKYPTQNIFPSHLPLHVVALSVENLWLELYDSLCII